MSMQEYFRDTVAWERSIEDTERYPGEGLEDGPLYIPGRIREAVTPVDGDRVSNLTVQVLAEHQVRSGDSLNGAEVLEVKAAKDGEGNVRYWTCLARR